MYRLFSWEHSYFSGKVRAYLRFKQRQRALGPGYEDILATPDLIQGLLVRLPSSLQPRDMIWLWKASRPRIGCASAEQTQTR